MPIVQPSGGSSGTTTLTGDVTGTGSGTIATTISPAAQAVPNVYAASFTLPATSGLALVGYITLQSNSYITVPAGSTLYCMN